MIRINEYIFLLIVFIISSVAIKANILDDLHNGNLELIKIQNQIKDLKQQLVNAHGEIYHSVLQKVDGEISGNIDPKINLLNNYIAELKSVPPFVLAITNIAPLISILQYIINNPLVSMKNILNDLNNNFSALSKRIDPSDSQALVYQYIDKALVAFADAQSQLEALENSLKAFSE